MFSVFVPALVKTMIVPAKNLKIESFKDLKIKSLNYKTLKTE